MPYYSVRVTFTETHRYYLKANSPEEAKDRVMSGEYESTQLVDASIDDVVVEEDEIR